MVSIDHLVNFYSLYYYQTLLNLSKSFDYLSQGQGVKTPCS